MSSEGGGMKLSTDERNELSVTDCSFISCFFHEERGRG
jgi:hypothetical protein